MALILSRTNQRLTVVHDQDPDTDKSIGKQYAGNFRSADGQPSGATRIEVSPISGDVWERATKADDPSALRIDAAGVTLDGSPVKSGDLSMGWQVELDLLIREISIGPLASRPSLSQPTTAGDDAAPPAES